VAQQLSRSQGNYTFVLCRFFAGENLLQNGDLLRSTTVTAPVVENRICCFDVTLRHLGATKGSCWNDLRNAFVLIFRWMPAT
jgi:hypothetical protein